MRKTALIAAGVAILTSLAGFLPEPIVQPAIAQNAAILCVSRKTNAPDGRDVIIMIPAGQQSQLVGRGFAVRACSVNSQQLANFRAKMCELASKTSPAIQAEFTRLNKVSPREMCDLATAIGTVQ